jgi:hypothetical protein
MVDPDGRAWKDAGTCNGWSREKACQERAMRSRTTTIAEIMLGVTCCGVLFHLLRLLLILVRMPGMEWLGALLISTPGVVIGAIVQRYRGGFVVLGAVTGGMVWNAVRSGSDRSNNKPRDDIGVWLIAAGVRETF